MGSKPKKRCVKSGSKEVDLAVFSNIYLNVIPSQPDRVWVGDIAFVHIALA